MIHSKVASVGWSKEHLPSDQGYALTAITQQPGSGAQVPPELLNNEEFEAQYQH
jgi:hypothetical protein